MTKIKIEEMVSEVVLSLYHQKKVLILAQNILIKKEKHSHLVFVVLTKSTEQE